MGGRSDMRDDYAKEGKGDGRKVWRREGRNEKEHYTKEGMREGKTGDYV